MKSLNKFIFLFIAGFILNLLWEILHYQLYYDFSGISKYPHILFAAFTDAVIIIFIFLIISLKNKSIKWVNKPKLADYLLIILFGLGTAIFIEIRALSIGRWAYKSSMPAIFGIGLSPLIQLAITTIISLLLIRLSKCKIE